MNYNILLARPDNPFSFPTVIPPFALPTFSAMKEFFDDMWRDLAGFALDTSDDHVRCYVQECTNFLDFEWAYAFNYATEVDQSLWPSGEVDVVPSKRQFEFRIYLPKESDVDLDAWASLAKLVLPLWRSNPRPSPSRQISPPFSFTGLAYSPRCVARGSILESRPWATET